MPNKVSSFFLLALLVLFALPARTQDAMGQERIISFHSDITVHADASMTVTETIKVFATNTEIRRGIYRDFPTRYKDRYGNNVVVGFTVEAVTRNGAVEPYHTENQSNGVRVYIGSADVYIPFGEHTYTLRYATNRQLGFFDDHDELYWNVTGNGWIFPIEQASATVTLPADIPRDAMKVEGYTGPQGSKGQAYQATLAADGTARFVTTQPLAAYEGLTIVVSFPTGYITRPTKSQQLGYLLRDNRGMVIAVIGLLLIAGYFLASWRKVGRDPEKGVIIPLYSPPDGYSPAALRYIMKMGYDHKAFAATIIHAAVQGELTIVETKKNLLSSGGKYSISRKDGATGDIANAELASEEEILLNRLFSRLGNTVTFSNSYYQDIQNAISAFQTSLKGRYGKKFFNLNHSSCLLGTLFSLAVIVISIWQSQQTPGAIGALLIIPIVLLIAMNILFYHLMKAPTQAGRKLMDDIEGFRLYLEVAEKDEMNLRNPPEKTPQLFEAFLPYALALDVEQAWSKKFAAVLARVSEEGRPYEPRWYHGNSWRTLGAAGFAGALSNSFSSAISSSSTAPGSSSGSGGGGSSGGGGGGGGGGGW